VTAGIQCDGPACRTFVPGQPAGWLVLMRAPEEERTGLAALFGTPQQPATFCGEKCLANWAYLQVVPGPATGAEPPPRSGVGWPR